jgi:F-type H+-transporting ATPase subunit epsilon
MANTFNLDIVTPERKFFSGDIEEIVLKTPEGEIGILAGHTSMVIAVAVGPIRIKKDGDWIEAVLTDGFMEIRQGKTVILTDTALWPNEVDLDRAESAKRRAEERLERQLSRIESMRSQAALARALARLKVGKELK